MELHNKVVVELDDKVVDGESLSGEIFCLNGIVVYGSHVERGDRSQ